MTSNFIIKASQVYISCFLNIPDINSFGSRIRLFYFAGFASEGADIMHMGHGVMITRKASGKGGYRS